jgi:hypothetical protein
LGGGERREETRASARSLGEECGSMRAATAGRGHSGDWWSSRKILALEREVTKENGSIGKRIREQKMQVKMQM